MQFSQFFFVSPLFWTTIILALLLWTLPSWYISWSLVFAWVLVQTVLLIQRLSLLVKSTGSDQFFTYFFGRRLSSIISDNLVLYMFIIIYLPFSFFPQDFQRQITGTCVSAGQGMLHQSFWGNSETMRSKMQKKEREIICSTIQYFFCQQL